MRTSSRPRSMSRSRSSRARSPSWSARMRWCGRPRRGRSRSTRRSPTGRRLNTSAIVDRSDDGEVTRSPSISSTDVLSRERVVEPHRSATVRREHRSSMPTGDIADVQRLRPRRHHRPPPDAQARRLLRQAAAVPARRLRHHRPGHRPRPHGARPWRGRFRAVQGERHRPGVRGRGATASIAPTGCGSAARAASSTPSSTRPTGRSARTCARPARCSPRAPTSSTATRIRGGRRPRSSTAAPRNGSSPWTSR